MPGTTPPPFDARWLTGPVDKADMRAYAASVAGARKRYSPQKIAMYTVLGVMAFVFVIPRVIGIFVGAPLGSSGVLPIAFMIGILFVVINLVMRHRGRDADYRLHRFAQANGMEFYPQDTDPNLPGAIFRQGHSRHAPDRVRGTQPRFVEFANYQYTTGSGKSRRTHTWGYVAIKLDAPLPHIVLDAKGNNGLLGSNLPAVFSASQRLRLEGNFDEFFSLYCPEGYETDALYLFTPDVMARLMDQAAELDIEIVDDWMFLYSKRELVTLDPNTWAWLFSVVSVLLDKVKRWERWRDERLVTAPPAHALPATGPTLPFAEDPATVVPVPPIAQAARLKGVAREGRRLDRGVSWPAIIVVTIIVLGAIALFFGPVLAGIFSGF